MEKSNGEGSSKTEVVMPEVQQGVPQESYGDSTFEASPQLRREVTDKVVQPSTLTF
jgi:hypothetical protein